ncbi:MAG: succinate dehydrogenase [Candidatus Marinimicrobia bacterium]|nr:succinate dehydrogenase [Candidatus Neomarinimicrobiota bacterium]|tara:strand:- start:40062 stop:40901 length:840 start_codon:yes stop_codon:yes gene_type:complete
MESSNRNNKLATNSRTDRWWFEPLWTGLGFLAFVTYTTWSMFQAEFYWFSDSQGGFGGYLSPFYSPLIFINPSAAGSASIDHAWFGSWPTWWPKLIPASPAILILMGPLSFRMTCYYYRKFYYRSYFLSPPACSVVGIPRKEYKGETGLLIIQNLHRYTMYIAIVFIVILTYDAIMAFFRNGDFGIGVGSIILMINPILLAGYTFGCHALRHLAGGNKNCFSCPNGKQKIRYRLWKGISWLNSRHMMWAWLSMIWVALADIYIRMVAMGKWIDYNTWSM